MKPLNVALVGCGIISEDHVRAYSHHANRARIVVCCDIDKEKQLLVPPRWGARPTTRFENILNDPGVDAVEICTPHPIHADAVIVAARAGKHILCQKPLARTLEECDAMIAAVNEANVTLFYGETNRTLPAALQARKMIDSGSIGTVIGLQARAAYWQGGVYMTTEWRYDPATTGGGQLLDGGIHAIDLMLHLGGPIAAVSCYTTRFRPELGGEDTAVVNARFVEGHLGSLFASQAVGNWVPEANCIVFGTDGVLTLGGTQGALVLYRRNATEQKQVLLERNGDPFAAMVGQYLDTIYHEKASISPPSVGRANLAVVLAAYESAREKREVRIEEIESLGG